MPKSKSALDLLSRVELFEGLSRAELRKVAALAKPVEFPAGEAMTEEGTPGGRFYLIESGTAKVVSGGRTRATLGPGDHFGELSLIDGEPRTASVVALEPLRTWSIAEWNFRPLLKHQGLIAYKLLVQISRRLRAAQKVGYTD